MLEGHDFTSIIRKQFIMVKFIAVVLACILCYHIAQVHSSANKIKVCKHGTFILNDFDNYVSEHLRLYGEWAEKELDLFLQVVKPGDIVIDAGANIGAFTVPLAKRVGPTGRVHSFEPQKVINQRLITNVVLNDLENVDVYLAALGNTTGTILVPNINYQHSSNFGAVSLVEPLPNQTESTSYAVPMHTLDEMNFYNPITQSSCPNFIKMDVERMEKWVLQGATQLLQRCRPFIHAENNAMSTAKGLIEHLYDIDYIPYWDVQSVFNPDNANKVDYDISNGHISMNVFCVPREMLKEYGGKVVISGHIKVERERPYLADYNFTNVFGNVTFTQHLNE